VVLFTSKFTRLLLSLLGRVVTAARLADQLQIQVVDVLLFVHPEFFLVVFDHYFFVHLALVLDHFAALVHRVILTRAGVALGLSKFALALELQHHLVLLEQRQVCCVWAQQRLQDVVPSVQRHELVLDDLLVLCAHVCKLLFIEVILVLHLDLESLRTAALDIRLHDLVLLLNGQSANILAAQNLAQLRVRLIKRLELLFDSFARLLFIHFFLVAKLTNIVAVLSRRHLLLFLLLGTLLLRFSLLCLNVVLCDFVL